MRAPSEKNLIQTFGLTRDEAKMIRKLAKAADDGEALEELVNEGGLPQTERWVRQMHSDPYNSRMWRISVALAGIAEVLGPHGAFGVEALGPDSNDYQHGPIYEYVNMGDTYATTLIYRRATDNLFISNYGDIVEKARW